MTKRTAPQMTLLHLSRKGSFVETIERRTYAGTVEFRRENDGRVVATGYAAVFNTLSQNLGGFVEQVAPGAFAQTLTQQDVRALFNHDPNHVLGRMGSASLRMVEDEKGLAYEIDLPDTNTGRDVATLLERRDVVGSSFGFNVISDAWSETAEGFPLRTLNAVSLRDVGPVTFPAYTSSEAALRSLAEQRSLDLPLLVAAAEAGRLAEVLTPADADEQSRATRTLPIIRRYRALR